MYANIEDSPVQSRILRQLKGIFPSMPQWRLREVCKANNWHLDTCIDDLTNADNNVSNVINYPMSQKQHTIEKQNELGKSNFHKDEERIGSMIKKGYRIMILMRGPPGVGKSYLARSLLTNFLDLENGDYSIKDFICSSDDYFYTTNEIYKYNSAFITDAHEFNHRRVKDKTNSGLSPIIIDNTNMQLWEMLPYVKYAVQNNYLIEILQPKTQWRNSAKILAQKNKHGVPLNRIQQIMEKYEECDVASLTRMLKNTKYNKTLPQMRSLPPLNRSRKNSPVVQSADISNVNEDLLEKQQSQIWNANGGTEPKEQRTKFRSIESLSKSEDSVTASTRNVYSLLEKKTSNAWKSFESHSSDFWGIDEPKCTPLNDSSGITSSEKSLLDLLREDTNEATNYFHSIQQDTLGENRSTTLERSSLERHCIDCPNENPSFVSLRQIYPNKILSGLWDLFVKCNGDIDWVIDILLKEDELERTRSNEDVVYQSEDDEQFKCFCHNINKEIIVCQDKNDLKDNIDKKHNATKDNNQNSSKSQRQRSRFCRSSQRTNSTLMDIKENIENCFVLPDDLYSEHLLKIRNIRTGTNEATCFSNNMAECFENVADNDLTKHENEREDDNESQDCNQDMLEMLLGEQLIQQLVDTFRKESSLEVEISSTLPANLTVFMPRSLAKQLYMLWVESAFNHMEEERQKVVREDEDFARLLKNPKYSEFKQSPSNLREILDMEYAWKIANVDKDHKKGDIDMENMHMPSDLASHLTQMKLCESFPDIPRETLLDMLAANDNDYNATVAILRSTMKQGDISTAQEPLIELSRREQKNVKVSNNWEDNDQRCNLSPDEAKRLALREFEESRNLAAHHCQLKAECYQKAKEAIQSGNGGAAIYYSQIANLHIKKVDMYNHRAANCIMDVHKNTQNNPDLLDLHYLYLIEALGCLDLFLDRHITGLRLESRNYKHVFIITGRGKHSAGGVSTIKNKVKARLKERCLRWSEVNPGLLKVKIFSGSRHSKNI